MIMLDQFFKSVSCNMIQRQVTLRCLVVVVIAALISALLVDVIKTYLLDEKVHYFGLAGIVFVVIIGVFIKMNLIIASRRQLDILDKDKDKDKE